MIDAQKIEQWLQNAPTTTVELPLFSFHDGVKKQVGMRKAEVWDKQAMMQEFRWMLGDRLTDEPEHEPERTS